MDEQILREINARFERLERESVRFRRGELSVSSGALSIDLGDSGVPVPAANSTLADIASALVAGNNPPIPLGVKFRQVGGTGEPAFNGAWVNYDSTNYQVVSFCKDILGFVHLRGAAKNGTAGTSIFTLPAGYRPAKTLGFPIAAGASTSALEVTSAGAVGPYGAVGNTYISLNGISFKAEL
jgi:hypothetical protein